MIHYISLPLISSLLYRNVFVPVLQAVSQKLMAGFVECLESEEAEEGAEKVDGKGKHLVTFMQIQNCSNHPLTANNVTSYLFK